MKTVLLLLSTVFILVLNSCQRDTSEIRYDFDSINDRIWIGEDFWTIPIEDWKISNARIEFTGKEQHSTCNLLPYVLDNKDGSFVIRIEMGMIERGDADGSSGIVIGLADPEDRDVKAAVYFGQGINIGVSTAGFAFIEQNISKLSGEFDYSHFYLEISGNKEKDGYLIDLKVIDRSKKLAANVSFKPESNFRGIIQMVNNFKSAVSVNNGPKFWFDNLALEGPAIIYKPENKFGPILWTMHTLSRNTLKLSVQMPPIGENDNQELELQFKTGKQWVSYGKQPVEADSRMATFKVKEWNSSEDKDYRVLYHSKDLDGIDRDYDYSGTIRRDPVDRPLNMGALTCQYFTGFPYSPLVRNLELKKPDLLYFSGDQIYEGNGGYPIKRTPEDTAIINYLGKWYMFGWAFGNLMRDIPTICTPDDHDVYQGNIWGGGGIPRPTGTERKDDLTGFTQTVKMVNVVNRTQCSHLPDPYDPSPIEQGMSVWYTSLNYGRVSFAIVSDRVFKSGPDLVAKWEGRRDHILKPLKDPSVIDMPGLELLGKRQEQFLESWIKDWENVEMKVLLSQTLFANVATHHGRHDSYLLGDMDSGGWPKKARDRAIEIIRKGFVFHISGDQHLPSLVQYGLDEYNDAGWSFCTPAISVVYSRWFRPDEMNIPVRNRPEHDLPNTGQYRDVFGNLNYVYAIGNPGNFDGIAERYRSQNEKSAGFGFVEFNKETRDIKLESWHFLSDISDSGHGNQYPGWPLTINQMDNYGRDARAWLPMLKIKGEPDPVIEIINQSTGSMEYIVRINGNEFLPKVFSVDKYTITVGYPEKDLYRKFTDITSVTKSDGSQLIIEFD